MFCPKCGKQIPDGSKFCTGCGNPVAPLSGGAQKEAGQTPQAQQTPTPAPQAPKPMPQAPEKPPKQQQSGGGKTLLILGIVFAVLVLVAAGMGIFYVAVVRNGVALPWSRAEADADEEAEDDEDEEDMPDEEDEETPEEDAPEEEGPVEDTPEEEPEEQEAPEEEAVVSDVYEVVGDRILENIPKAAYSYRFDGDLGGAEVVVREQPDSEPEAADSTRAQYVRGMDGDAVWLDGTYGLKLSDVESLQGPYTIAFWMKAEELCDWSPFIHIGKNLLDESARYRVWIGQKPDGHGGSRGPILSSEQPSKKLSVEIDPDKGAESGMIEGVWYHVAFTVYGTQNGRVAGTLYLAGSPVGQGDVILNELSGDDASIYLGINCWDDLYPVAFDDVKIWDHALADEQIAELCAAYE